MKQMTLTPTTEPTASDAAGILYFMASVKCSQYLLLYIYIYIYILFPRQHAVKMQRGEINRSSRIYSNRWC